MPVTVYFWSFRGPKSVGHLSMSLSNGRYISHWPKGDKRSIWKVTSSQYLSLDIDIRAEGRTPDETLVFPANITLDERKIEEWWNSFIPKAEYHLLGQNCAQVVEEALKAGGFEIYDYTDRAGPFAISISTDHIFEEIKFSMDRQGSSSCVIC
ncbi:hypothetical protein Bhyg_12789 [Pseudolycoriella hygida]|uniref:Uncharacterized protein n=1 Tax=Pseudolycoriella hygida TaxID=35572 RepID=A0A9Q0MZH8_9DIPT|nr:hypothetical protein Bhyg_12789 [Pseudolycoriella hygida]